MFDIRLALHSIQKILGQYLLEQVTLTCSFAWDTEEVRKLTGSMCRGGAIAVVLLQTVSNKCKLHSSFQGAYVPAGISSVMTDVTCVQLWSCTI